MVQIGAIGEKLVYMALLVPRDVNKDAKQSAAHVALNQSAPVWGLRGVALPSRKLYFAVLKSLGGERISLKRVKSCLPAQCQFVL